MAHPSTPVSRSFSRSFSTLGCVEQSFDQVCSLAERHGLEAIELRGLFGTLELPDALAAHFVTPAAFGRQVKGRGLRLGSLDSSLRLAENSDEDRRALLAYVPWAEAAGVPYLRVFDGAISPADPAAFKRAVDTLEWWNRLRAAEGWKVDLMMETHTSLLTSPRILAFLSEAPAGTKILWDTHHTWRRGGEELATTWRAIGRQVVHLHVKDSVAHPTPQDPQAYHHVVCGAGQFPMRDLLALLQADRYAGLVSLEWERHWHPEMPPLEQALGAAAASKWW